MTLFDMTGKVAVVTGSSRGIGRAIAERMAEHGARVVISSRKQQACDAVAKAINDKAGKQVALAVAANISTKDDLKNLTEETNRVFGTIDTLVCNAASNPYYGPQAGISDDQFRKILDNNIVANHWLISLVVPQMIARKDGSITIISSIGGLKGSTVLGAYAISKAADMQLARNLACEYGPHNIRVNCIAPGLIKTDFAKALWDNPETLKASTARSPLLRIGEPDEIAGAAVFLASAAGSFTTGQTIVIDGGATDQLRLQKVSRRPGATILSANNSLHRRIDQTAHQRAEMFTLAGALRHEDGKQLFLRIDPEEGSGHPAPEELADRAGEGRHAFRRSHRKAEAEAVTRRHQMGFELHAGIEMVGRHQLQGLAADDPVAVEHAAIEQHLAEPRVIHGGGDQAAAAGFHHRRFQHVEELNFLAAPGIDRERLGEPIRILRPGVKRGLGHLQGREDAFGQEGAQGFAGDDFDDAAENVGGTAVVPFGAGLAHQRQAGDQGGVFGIADLAAAHPRLLVQLLHQAVAGMLVGDARGVPQQVMDRDRPLGAARAPACHCFRRRPSGPKNSGTYFAIGSSSRKVPSSSSIMMPTETIGLVIEKMRNRLLSRHRRGAGGILPAERVEPADLTATRDHHRYRPGRSPRRCRA